MYKLIACYIFTGNVRFIAMLYISDMFVLCAIFFLICSSCNDAKQPKSKPKGRGSGVKPMTTPNCVVSKPPSPSDDNQATISSVLLRKRKLCGDKQSCSKQSKSSKAVNCDVGTNQPLSTEASNHTGASVQDSGFQSMSEFQRQYIELEKQKLEMSKLAAEKDSEVREMHVHLLKVQIEIAELRRNLLLKQQ